MSARAGTSHGIARFHYLSCGPHDATLGPTFRWHSFFHRLEIVVPLKFGQGGDIRRLQAQGHTKALKGL